MILFIALFAISFCCLFLFKIFRGTEPLPKPTILTVSREEIDKVQKFSTSKKIDNGRVKEREEPRRKHEETANGDYNHIYIPLIIYDNNSEYSNQQSHTDHGGGGDFSGGGASDSWGSSDSSSVYNTNNFKKWTQH